MKKYNIKVNGISYEVEVEEIGGSTILAPSQSAPILAHQAVAASAAQTPATAPIAQSSTGANSITAPMPGSIVKVNVKPGDVLKKGDLLLVLEAMKMENDITAPADCTISSVNVNQGATVSTGDVLVTYN